METLQISLHIMRRTFRRAQEMEKKMKHATRYSDSSLYDTVCTACGATDAAGDDRLKFPCHGSELDGKIAAAARKVVLKKEELRLAQKALDELVRQEAKEKVS